MLESIKLESEEADEEEDDHLQEVYRQEMGKRPIYAKKKTKGYIQWLEQQRELRVEKIRNSHAETETKQEIEDEDWKKTLKKWIKEASEDECGAELTSELKKALESYNNFEDLTRKFFELYKKSQSEKLSEKEKSRMASLLEKLQEFDPIQLELLANIRAIKKYIIEQYGWDSMNRFRDYRVRNKFFGQISQKYENIKKDNKVKKRWIEKQRELNNNFNKSTNILNPFTGSVWDYCYGVIYLLTDNNNDGALPNKMHYIGVTIRKLRKRFLEHIRSTENRYLEKAFNRYHKKFNVDTTNESFSSTVGNEFTIEVIDNAKDLIELGEKEIGFINKYKTFIYDHFTLINNEFIPLYGYNLTRGGYGRPALYGFLNPRYINIPRDDFKKLITLGYRTHEIAREFNIALSTVHAKIIEFWGDQGIININSARKTFGGWNAFKSRGNIDVNLEELIQLIEDGAFMREICDKLGVSRFAVLHRLEQLGASDLTHARFMFGGMEIYKKRLNEVYTQTLIKYGKELNYQYVQIPENELKNLIENGFDEFQIAELYNISNVTVRARVKEHWGITFFGAVLLFRIFKMIDESYLETLIRERLSVEEIERLFYIKLISRGHTPTSISKYFDFKRPAISNRIKKSLGMNFNDAQDIYFYKPRIIAEIKNGAKNAVDIASLLDVNSHNTIISHMKKIWWTEFSNLYDSNYPKNSPRHFNNFFQYLIKFYNENN